ncbi:hypothetical protein BMS3Abin07_01580 [bacterium BMS3Abin07]|nr:hypothetical protein BMS3Abin07_01580 [bacterium BMS3Abin07]
MDRSFSDNTGFIYNIGSSGNSVEDVFLFREGKH